MNLSALVLKCVVCHTRRATQLHHKFSQTKWARKLYGALLDDQRNLAPTCADCHSSHASPELEHWDEVQFCTALGIPPRSKAAQRIAPIS